MTTKRILLVDDDDMYGRLMHAQADRLGIDLTYCRGIDEFLRTGSLSQFDVVLLDYDLGWIKGSALAEFCQVFFAQVPVVIVSSTSDWWFKTGLRYPQCVKCFIHKETPLDSALARALDAAEPSNGLDLAGDDFELVEPNSAWAALGRSYAWVMQASGLLLMRAVSRLVAITTGTRRLLFQ
jgi:hypothetical protein